MLTENTKQTSLKEGRKNNKMTTQRQWWFNTAWLKVFSTQSAALRTTPYLWFSTELTDITCLSNHGTKMSDYHEFQTHQLTQSAFRHSIYKGKTNKQNKHTACLEMFHQLTPDELKKARQIWGANTCFWGDVFTLLADLRVSTSSQKLMRALLSTRSM